MTKLRTLLLLLALLPALACLAGPDEKPAMIDLVKLDAPRGPRAVETEPNNDCTQADGPIVDGGDYYFAEIYPGMDQDWYAFEVDAGGCAIFETHFVDFDIDTELYLIGEDCDLGNPIKFDDDGGVGHQSRFQHTFPEAGTYYVVVLGALNNTIGYYILTAVTCENPPPNDTCDTAIDLREQGLETFFVDLCLAADDCSPGGAGNSCTGWTAQGPDVVYSIYLLAGDLFEATEQQVDTYVDCSLYLVTDCDDMPGTCVAGSDSGNPETISYIAESTGRYYLVVDNYQSCGVVQVDVTLPTATGVPSGTPMELPWSTLKTLY